MNLPDLRVYLNSSELFVDDHAWIKDMVTRPKKRGTWLAAVTWPTGVDDNNAGIGSDGEKGKERGKKEEKKRRTATAGTLHLKGPEKITAES